MRLFQYPGTYVFLVTWSVYPFGLFFHYVIYNFVMNKTMLGLTEKVSAWSVLFSSLNLASIIYAAIPSLIAIVSFFIWWVVYDGVSPWWDKAFGVLSVVSFVTAVFFLIFQNIKPIFIL